MSALAIALFVCALAVIAFEWMHRTKVALVGAGLMIVIGSSTPATRLRRWTGRRSDSWRG